MAKSGTDARVKGLRTSILRGDLPETTRLMRLLFETAHVSGIEIVHQKQLLMASHDGDFRRQMGLGYLRLIMEVLQNDSVLKREATYVTYCEVVAKTRDDIALRASELARGISRYGEGAAVESCCAAVWRIARRYTNWARKNRPERGADPATNAEFHSEFGWELTGIFDLLDSMLWEVGKWGPSPQTAPCKTFSQKKGLLKSAYQLARVAEDWQALNEFRQRVAFGDLVVDTVEGSRIYVSPGDFARTRTEMYSRLRLGNREFGRPHNQVGTGPFASYIDFLCMFTHIHLRNMGINFDFDELREDLAGVQDSMKPLDFILRETLRETDEETSGLLEACWALGFVANGLRLAGMIARGFNGHRFGRRGVPYFIPVPRSTLIHVFGEVLRWADKPTVEKALSLMTGDPKKQAPLDLLMNPFVDLGNDSLGVLHVPHYVDVFLVSRRILSEGNSTSRSVGTAYEGYIRELFEAHGFNVAPSQVRLRRDDDTPITDIDVLAYKDGVFFVIQAKYLVEPHTHHVRWQARQAINYGIRQSLQAREFVLKRPDVLYSAIPGMRRRCSEQDKVCFVVVSPAWYFSSDSSGPVTIIDESYLEHILAVGEVRFVDMASGEVTEAVPLYSGAEPTGPELKDMLDHPRFRDLYPGHPVLKGTRRRIRELEFHGFTLSLEDS